MPKRNYAKLSELKLIDYFSKLFKPKGKSVVKGIGDDAAVVRISKAIYLLATTDMLIEGKHFRRSANLCAVGKKALSCSLSDIAAMGGQAKFALVSLGLPQRLGQKDVGLLYRGIKSRADKYKVEIIGGDTNASDKLVVDVSMLGFVKPQRLVLRSTAKTGDYIFVTGALGGSIHQRHLTFSPRLKEVEFLLDRIKLNSLIDISDGLTIDLGRILRASRVGAVIFESLIPLHRNAKNINEALYMGEDFELLFTVSPNAAKKIFRMIKQKKIPFPVSFIGTVINAPGKIYLTDRNNKTARAIAPRGFLHF